MSVCGNPEMNVTHMQNASTLLVHTPACVALATQEMVKHAQVRCCLCLLIKFEKTQQYIFCVTSWLFDEIFHVA